MFPYLRKREHNPQTQSGYTFARPLMCTNSIRKTFLINSVVVYSDKPFEECPIVYATMLAYTVN